MIAEDFGPVRVLATEGVAGTTVEGARARTGPKDPRGRGQRSPLRATIAPGCRITLENHGVAVLHERPGEKCGLGISKNSRPRGSSKPRRDPACEKLWQGNPPARMSTAASCRAVKPVRPPQQRARRQPMPECPGSEWIIVGSPAHSEPSVAEPSGVGRHYLRILRNSSKVRCWADAAANWASTRP